MTCRQNLFLMIRNWTITNYGVFSRMDKIWDFWLEFGLVSIVPDLVVERVSSAGDPFIAQKLISKEIFLCRKKTVLNAWESQEENPSIFRELIHIHNTHTHMINLFSLSHSSTYSKRSSYLLFYCNKISNNPYNSSIFHGKSAFKRLHHKNNSSISNIIHSGSPIV